MPDNIKRGSEKLVDEGWKSMSTLLDQEMPQRKRRGGALWLISGVALLILLVSAMLLRDGAGDVDATAYPEPTQAQADASQPEAEDVSGQLLPGQDEQQMADHRATEETEPSRSADGLEPSQERTGASNMASAASGSGDQVEAGSSNDETQDAVTNATETTTDLNQESVTAPASIPATAEPADESVEELAVVDATADQVQSETPTTAAEGTKITETPGEHAGPADDDAAARTSFDLASVGSLESTVTIPERAMIAAEFQRPLRKTWSLAAFTAGHFEDAVLMHGVEGGLALTIDLGRRTRLTTGLSYGHYRERGIWALSGSKFAAQLSNEQDQMDSTITGGANSSTLVFANEIYDNTINYDTIRILADRYNYLHLPVIFKYRVSPKLDIGIGAKVSRLLSAPSEYAINSQTSSFAAGVSRDAQGPNNFLYNYNILRRYDVAPVFGLSWAIGRNTAIDVSYQHGLVPFVDRSGIMDRTDYHKSVSVGLRVDLF